MKLNISYPATGCQKLIEVDDDRKLRSLYDKRVAMEVEGDNLGDEFKGYVFKISGGNDKQGFPMKQGVLRNTRVRLLLSKNHSCYRPRRKGERKRKSVRGCIVGSDLAVLNLVVVKKGESDIPGLTDEVKPRRLGPKRASKLKKLFDLQAGDDVRDFLIPRKVARKDGKTFNKRPKIQRLVTPIRLHHKAAVKAEKKRRYTKSRALAETYNAMMAERLRLKLSSKHQVQARRRLESLRKSATEAKEKGKK